MYRISRTRDHQRIPKPILHILNILFIHVNFRTHPRCINILA